MVVINACECIIKSIGKSKKPVNCCYNNGTKLPSSLRHKMCMEVETPVDDKIFIRPIEKRVCMNYVRSVPAMRSDCTFGPREQVTAI